MVSSLLLFRTSRLYAKPLEAVFTFPSHPSTVLLTSYRVKEAVFSPNCCNKSQTRSIWDTICTWGCKSSKPNSSRGITQGNVLPLHGLARHPAGARHLTAVQARHQTLAIKPKEWERPETQPLYPQLQSHCIAASTKQTCASWRLREIHICPRDTNRCT